MLGASGVLLAIVQGLFKQVSGKARRQRAANATAESQRVKAIEQRDQADAKRRIIAEYASRLRRQLLELGATPEEWPDTDHTIPAAEVKRLRERSND